MLTKALREIAVIRTGYPFRGGIQRAVGSGCWLVQVGNIGAETGEIEGELTEILQPPRTADHELRRGDVLLIGRGVKNLAATYGRQESSAIAAAHLIVLRPQDQFLAPEYLTWFLNLPRTQAHVAALQSGSSVPFISVETLEQFRVPLPSMELQRKIGGISRLRAEEERLASRLKELNRHQIDTSLMNLITVES